MKKKLLLSLFLGILSSVTLASAYYTYSNNYYNNTSGARASYTIGCTTYYYNPYTREQLYTEYVCTTYTYPTYQYQTYPYQYYTYPTTPYYTYQYSNGSWNTPNYGYNQNYGCYYQNGYQYCY